MSDNIPLPRQRQCTDLGCEDEKYILDIFSYVQPETRGRCESRKQLFVFITRDVENNRLSKFLQVMCSVWQNMREAYLQVHFKSVRPVQTYATLLARQQVPTMLRPLAHRVACCCTMLETRKTFSYVQTDAITLRSCCVRLQVA